MIANRQGRFPQRPKLLFEDIGGKRREWGRCGKRPYRFPFWCCLENCAQRDHADRYISARSMNIHEYQAKQLLAQYGVNVPPGEVCETPEAARQIAAQLLTKGAKLLAVQSHIHAGGH